MDEEESGDLQESLLPDARPKEDTKSISAAVFNLSKVIIGAGEHAYCWQHLQLGFLLLQQYSSMCCVQQQQHSQQHS
jgi:hypothetical protein